MTTLSSASRADTVTVCPLSAYMQRSAAKVVLEWIVTVAYVFTEHCCRACFGRILHALDGAHYRCAECGLISSHPKVTALCACGTKLGNGRLVGLRCHCNPDGPTPEAPAEIADRTI